MLSAVVLAAGASQRMGSPKALLRIGGKTFLRHIVDILASAHIDDIVIVLGADEEKVRESLSWFGGTIAVNGNWREGQLSSILTGLNALKRESVRGAMVCPVDHPLLTTELVSTLLHTFKTSKKRIVLPTYGGRRGHPVIFDVSLFDELQLAPREVGARAVIRGHSVDIEEVPSSERGAIVDIATADDYEREILRREE